MEDFLLRDYEDNYAPPEQPCLRVGVSGDVVFLTLVKVEETHTARTEETLHTIGVYRNELIRGLTAACLDDNDQRVRVQARQERT